ncbi:PIG-L deacetylase family protein [Alicyclobacillus shizuokensis]|uniref:PIG-L deacetylase family protein n=1 Tax=Alicyclobacillus shizuokensis TaxID=392014 RepID=UPI00082C245B|nr:PIG-L deacetylase family protein [Alicyclobacillus shizuokensis]MCL6625222.1 PIG-L family deacetylase [Alicyclobacillus shizuokensis]
MATLMVVSAHAADFVWRAGGAIALYHDKGWQVRVLCLSYGERGESARLWKSGKTLDDIKSIRHAEAEHAAQILGADIRFLDAGDYPLEVTPELRDKLVQEFREHQPDLILTHSLTDPYNADHPRTTQLVLECRILAQAHGYPSPYPPIGAPPVFLYEPHQPEQCQFRIDALLDISSVFERKRQAMECMEAQEHLWAYYTDVAKRRGVQAGRNSGQSIRYAEAYQRVYPSVGGELV